MSHSSFNHCLRGVVLAAFALLLPALGLAQSAFPGSDPSTPANPTPLCATNTLAAYQNLGSQGCTVGAATFYSFKSAGYGDENGYLDPSLITITPSATGNPSIGFSSAALFALMSGAASYQIEYYIDPPIDILGFGLLDDPFANASVTAQVCTDNTFDSNCYPYEYGECDGPCSYRISARTNAPVVSPNGDPYTGPIDPYSSNYYEATIDPSNIGQQITFDQKTQFLDVLLTINLGLDPDQSSVITQFSQNPVVLPEPAETALLGAGGLVLLGSTWRRKRKTVACSA